MVMRPHEQEHVGQLAPLSAEQGSLQATLEVALLKDLCHLMKPTLSYSVFRQQAGSLMHR